MPKKTVDMNDLLQCEKKFGLHVLAEIHGWLETIRKVEPESAPAVKVSDVSRRWRIASAMQKAFRRGIEPTLVQMLAGLHSIDQNYAWRRFAIIVMEDAGVAVPPSTLAKLLVLVRGKYVRDHFGVTVDDLCRIARHINKFARDRTACYLAVEMEYMGLEDKAKANYAAGAGPEILLKMIQENPTEKSIQMAFFAVCESNFPVKNLELVLEAMNLTDTYVWFCAVEALRQRLDILGPFYALAYIKSLGHPPKYVDDDFPELAWIGPYPTCCFDQYVSDSTRAILYFLAMADNPYVKAIQQIFPNKADQVTVTKKLMFRVEGGLLCRRLQYPAAVEAKKRAYQLIVGSIVLGWDDYRKLGKLLFEQIPALNHARGKTITA